MQSQVEVEAGLAESLSPSSMLAKLSRTCSRIDPGQLGGECVNSNLGPSDAPAKNQSAYVLLFVP